MTDGGGKVTGYNERFVKMWRIPLDLMDSKEHRKILELTSRQFADPRRFLAKIDEIYASSPAESHDLLELTDGRVFERLTRIQFVDELNVGRVWSFREITERRRAEQALDQQSQWWRVTLASIGDAVVTTDTRGQVTFLKRIAESLLGWTQAEAQGRPLGAVFRVIHELSRQPVENPVERTLREDQGVGSANHGLLIAKDGSEIPIDDSAAPIRGELGQIQGVVLIFRDVTEARRAGDARLRLSAIVESSFDAIISKNLDGIIISWNKAAERLYGYTAEEAVGKPVSLLIPADHQDELKEIMARLKRGEQIKHFETVRLRKDGSRIDVSMTISPVQTAEGKIVGASKIARDITASKRAEQITRFLAHASASLAELTDYKTTLQRVADLSVPSFADWCAVDMLEADGSVRRIAVAHTDPATSQLADEFFYPPGTSAAHDVNVLRTGESEWLATILHDEDQLQRLRHLGLSSYICTPLRSRTRSYGALMFVTAESGRVYDTPDLAAAEDLAQRVAIALENANLLAALQETDRRKDEFLAMLAHELRNPLAPIRNSVQIIRSKGLPVPELQWATEVIDRQVHQMTRLVDDLLDVSRSTTGKIELRKERVELAEVVTSAVEASRPLIEKWGHALTVTLPPEPIHLQADLTRLAQVLLNILNNAAKYMDQGGRIWVTAERQSSHVLIRVKDSGIGIPKEMLSRIFEMFTQVDRSLERSEGGLGIGLTLVQRLVEMHGGTVEARSDGPGKGSEFVVRLPVSVEVRQGPQGAASDGEKDVAPAMRRILVVDDNRDAADSLGMLLRMLGNEVHTAHDGLEAVGAAAAFRPDVVLLDIGLPKLNGYEAARRIREQDGGSDMVLVAVTGWGQDEDRRRSKEAGFDHHLTKPVDYAALQRLLAQKP